MVTSTLPACVPGRHHFSFFCYASCLNALCKNACIWMLSFNLTPRYHRMGCLLVHDQLWVSSWPECEAVVCLFFVLSLETYMCLLWIVLHRLASPVWFRSYILSSPIPLRCNTHCIGLGVFAAFGFCILVLAFLTVSSFCFVDVCIHWAALQC